MPRTILYAMLVLASLLSGCPDAMRQDPTQEWIDRHAYSQICYSWWPLTQVHPVTESDSEGSLTSDASDTGLRSEAWLADGILTYQPSNQLEALDGYRLWFAEEVAGGQTLRWPMPILLIDGVMACTEKSENCGGIGDSDRPLNGVFPLDGASADGLNVTLDDLPIRDVTMNITGDQLQVDYLDAESQPASVVYSIGELVVD